MKPYVYQATALLGMLGGSILLAPAGRAGGIDLPQQPIIDENGVDLKSGRLTSSRQEIAIGPEEGGLSLKRSRVSTGMVTSFDTSIAVSASGATVKIGDRSAVFVLNSGVYVPNSGDGSQLVSAATSYTFTDHNGTVVVFDRATETTVLSVTTSYGTEIRYPDGTKITITYKTLSLSSTLRVSRIQSVNNNAGYQLKYSYGAAIGAPGGMDVSKITAINNSIDYCNPIADSCSLSQSWPEASYTYSAGGSQPFFFTVTDSAGRSTRYGYTSVLSNNTLTSIRYNGDVNDRVVAQYGSDGRVTQVTRSGMLTKYTWSYPNGNIGVIITDPKNTQRYIELNYAKSAILIDQNQLGMSLSSTLDTYGRISRMTWPEGNYVEYTYDSRGNVTSKTVVAKPGSGVANIVTTASYDATCANIAKCNQPNSVTDPKGNVTSFSYDPVTGLLATVTAPAATPGAVQPQVRYTYVPLYAYYKNSSGSIVASSSPLYKMTSVSSCATSASCSGGADEVRTITSYGPQTLGIANNLLPVSVSSGSGNGSITSTSNSTYDLLGNLVTVDGPLAGSADTVRYRYNGARQLIGVVSPDPDGAGSLKNRASRLTYSADGLVVTLAERGTVNGQSDADWTNFASIQQVASAYDNADRKVRESLTAGGSTYAVTQYSYDGAGRLDCTAVRMDVAQWGGQSDACVPQTNGPAGPDRVARNNYDAADRLISVTDGYGTSAQRTERTLSYTPNGLVQTVWDAANNLTTYEYDGFDRLSKTRFPVATVGANASSTTDYEQLGYDANGNVTSRRLRDGQMIYYGFDNLNRLTSKDRPNVAWWETDQGYGYDLLGRLTSASDSNGHSYTYSYDALGRKTTEASNWYGTLTSSYDLAGRRTVLTYPDGFYVNYDYLVTGEMAAVRESGANSGVGVLASYGYDNLGHRTSVTRGNGTTTSYGYDNVSRLASIIHDLAGTAQDLTLGFSYNSAPQITSTSRSNDSYAFTQGVNVNRGYAVNGLNQYSSAGGVSFGYDGRGNLTSSGSNSYGYTVDNQLATSPGSNFAYDPLGRLFHESAASSAMLYDGSAMVMERDSGSGAIRRRYVYGPGTDEPIVWYEGTGTADRRWLYADERGSIIATANASGGAIALNSYDEYGIPASTNIGRFQYTGQMWLPNLGMYSYKARIYSPTLGRFMQTDPIAYGDGLNWYVYAHNDPVNGTDPTGTDADIVVTGVRLPSIIDLGGLGLNLIYPGGIPTPAQLTALMKNALDTAEKVRKSTQKKKEVRSKRQTCNALGRSKYDVRKAWTIANTARKMTTDGKTNWDNPFLRESENWLTAASDYFTLPFAKTAQIYIHQYQKTLPFSDTTPFSQEALDAGLDGLSHLGDTPEQLEDWCNGN